MQPRGRGWARIPYRRRPSWIPRAKTTEEGARSNGYDAYKNIKGRKRHLLVDTLGLPLSVYVTSADVQDRVGTRSLLAGLKPFVPRLKKIWADGNWKSSSGTGKPEVLRC